MTDQPLSGREALGLPVAELLERFPGSAQTMLELRMACVGCDFSAFDTLAEALTVHNLPAEGFLARLIPMARGTPAGDDPSRQGGSR